MLYLRSLYAFSLLFARRNFPSQHGLLPLYWLLMFRFLILFHLLLLRVSINATIKALRTLHGHLPNFSTLTLHYWLQFEASPMME